MKKFIACLTAAAMLLAVGGCSQETATQVETTTQAAVEETAAEETTADTAQGQETTEDTTEGGSDVLVAYYSATGNTGFAAEYIADYLDADIFEVTPVEPYGTEDLDWTNDSSRVSQEYADESLRDVELETTQIENWEDYDTVFIGYPIWWGIAAWPMDSFVSANDFTGKTVIPFCTSASSGLGDSDTLLAECTSGGEWLPGQRFASGVSESEVIEWIDSLGLN